MYKWGWIPATDLYSDPALGEGEARNRALIAFRKHARAVISEFSSPIFLGELRETIKMIRSPAKGLRDIADSYLRDVKSQKKRSPKQWKKNLSSTWLEYAFGWTPLISDIQSGYKAYHNLVTKHENEQVLVSGFGIEEEEVTNPAVGSNSFGRIRYNHSLLVKDKAFVKFRGMVVRRVDATLREKLARIGFNAEEFLPTVWELLPWSFLIDYFTNIGDVIEASAFNVSALSWSTQTTVKTRTWVRTTWPDESWMRKVTPGPKYFVSFSGEPTRAVLERRIVNRADNAAIGIPSLSWELPGKPAQWANMTALFAQANSIHPQRKR